MKIMKKKINNGIFYVVISLVAVLAIGSVAAVAFMGNAQRVIENVEVYNEAPQPSVAVEDSNLGAVSGPNRYFPIFSDNGVQYAPINVPMQSATTTLCSIKNPFNATSTLEYFSYNITTATGTAANLVMATSTLYAATSTNSEGNLITARTVAANTQDSYVWRPTSNGGAYGAIAAGEVKSGEYILLQTEGGGLGGYTYTNGTCQAKFIKK